MAANMNRLIVVLGMHRSGTSAVTRGLQVLGVGLGGRLMPPAQGNNEKGFWEDIDINELNIEMLAVLGSDWECLAPITPEDVEVLRRKGYFQRAVEMLRQKTRDNHIFGFKDPRVAKLLAFWKEVFAHCHFDVSYVLSIRNPRSVVMSLIKRDGMEAEKGYLLWLEHVVEAVSGTMNERCVIVDYDYLIQSPERELERIAAQLALTVDPVEMERYRHEFLDEKLRHTRYEPEDLQQEEACPPLAYEVYADLFEMAAENAAIDFAVVQAKSAQWSAELARLKATLQLIDKLYQQNDSASRVLAEREDQVASLRQLVSAREAHNSELEHAVSERDGRIAERDVRIAGLQHEVAERDGQISGLQHAIAERDGQISGLQHAIAERDGQIAGLQQTVAERDGQIAGLDQSIKEILGSTSWRMTRPLRSAGTVIKKLRSLVIVMPLIVRKGGGVVPTLLKSVRIFRKEGLTGVKIRVRRFFAPPFRAGVTAGSQPPEVGTAECSPARFSIVPYYVDPKLSEQDASGKGASIAIHLHLHYTEMLDQFVSYLNNIPYGYDLYVSVSQTSDADSIKASFKRALAKAESVTVEAVPNRGRDIAPMIVQFGKRLAQYEIISHIHSKKSPHAGDLAGWCQDIMDLLFAAPGSRGGHVGHIIGMLQDTAKVVFPEPPAQILMDQTGWAANRELARQFLEKHTQISIDEYPVVEFPVGSMFWARAECLKEFLELPLTYADFPAEPIAADGTLAHVLERLILIFASKHPGQCIRLHHGDSIRDYRHYEEQRDYSAALAQTDIKVLSYYLPQFHPIPENDAWHGKGFTEWTKVRAANPLFEGHYQQHIPHADIGYYLLDSPETLRRQAEQMRRSGVHGQVFYHYWFSGKLILEEPAQMLKDHPDIEMPYCFCWANENWTRRWDGNEKEILLGQEYSAQDAAAFIQYLIPFFKDRRYISVEGRPVLFVYRPSSMPHPTEYLDIWEKECAKAGIARPYVVAVLTRGATDPRDFGMDAGVERVLHDWTGGAAPEIKDTLSTYRPFNGSALSYEDVAAFYMQQREEKGFTYFRSLVPIWDNTARYGSEAYLLHGSTPHRFQTWMERLIEYTRATLPEDRRFILVNAWNEWAEGAHLEPDSRYGYSYLNSVGRALSGIPYAANALPEESLPLGLRIHMAFPEPVLDQLRSDAVLRQRFIQGLSCSSIFAACKVSIDAAELAGAPALADKIIEVDPSNIDYVLQFRKVVFFAPRAIEKMARLAWASRNSVVLSNAYDSHAALIEATENASVRTYVAHESPMTMLPIALARSGFKNYKVRTDAHSFVTYARTLQGGKLPEVTTIIRFHRSGNLDTLSNALYSLAAMEGCAVTPLIAAQDLSEQQTALLETMLGDIPWAQGVRPLIHHYRSPGGEGDLRSRMLNESLRKVKTRYAGFLDYDDLLMSHAYSWLIDRLKQTDKAVSFGRVYRTGYNTSTGRYLKRERAFEYGYTYEEFLQYNIAPLHSFMLDLERLVPDQTTYFDDQRFMEDYYLTLQLITSDNADWEGLAQNVYIGDYIYSTDRPQTLAISDELQRQTLLDSPEYRICEQRVDDMRIAISARMQT
jgi:lipopolysaccharide biosynthesis protein